MIDHDGGIDTGSERPIDRWFAGYSRDHRNPVNQALHVACVPLILWSLIALLWTLPVAGSWLVQGFWAGLAMFLAWLYWYRASRRLGLGMLLVLVGMAGMTALLAKLLGIRPLFFLALAVFIAAWVGQFIGHKLEGRRPSFLTDLRYLLVGPAWVLAKLYRRLGWTF